MLIDLTFLGEIKSKAKKFVVTVVVVAAAVIYVQGECKCRPRFSYAGRSLKLEPDRSLWPLLLLLLLLLL